jgi:citrate synthase
MADKTLELIDTATGKKAVLPVRSGTVGPSVVDIAPMVKEFGAFTYDPGYGATAAVESKITYIDGEAGVLTHRGYPIEQLAAKSSFIEV